MPVTVEVPESVAGVVGALGDGAVVLAGGTQVMPRINTEAHDVATLVSLRRAGLGAIEVDGLGARVGAATTLAQLGAEARLAFLRPACETIASPTIRNLATVGGNLFVEQPYGDLAVALLALDAQVEMAGAGAPGTAAVADVLAGGIAAGQVVTAVRFALPAAGDFFHAKAMRRRLNSASIVTVAAVVRVSDGTVGSARIALGGAGRAPVRAVAAEAALAGQPFDREHVEVAAIAARVDAEPFSDAYASAWYEVGRALNPAMATQQIEGGAWMGISHALFETTEPYYPERSHGPTDFSEYLMPGPADNAEMRSVIIERPAPNGPFGAKGIGEMTANAPIPAIANAIFDACGVRLESMPFTPEKVLRGLDELAA